MKFLIGFLSEGDGLGSMMRLGQLLIVLGMIGLCFYITCCGEWDIYNSGMISTTLIGIFAMKAWQRKHEAKENIETLKQMKSEI